MMKPRISRVVSAVLVLLMAAAFGGPGQDVGSLQSPLSVSTIVPVGQYEAIGTVPGCTATLIDQTTVLTAAHCVCSEQGPNASHAGCSTRRTFTLHDVHPVDDPATTVNESLTRKDVSIDGTVYVNPEYGKARWLAADYAIIKLDVAANERVLNVTPIPVGLAVPNIPGEQVTAVGFGLTGSDCSTANADKRMATLTIADCGPEGITLSNSKVFTCPGDSGGPLINSQGRIIGVTSWGDSAGTSVYRPTYSRGTWISTFLQGYWTQIWGPVGDVVVGYNTIEFYEQLYATQRSTGDIYAFGGTGMDSWTRVGGPGKQFAVGGMGSLYGLNTDGGAVMQYIASAGGWVKVWGAAGAIYGAVHHAGRGLYATSTGTGALYSYDGATWTQISGPAKQFAFGSEGRVYRLAMDGSGVFRYDGTPGQWTQIGGPAAALFAAETSLYATDPNVGDLHEYNSTSSSWTTIGGPGKTFAVGDDDHLYGLAVDGSAVFQYTGYPLRWLRIGGAAAGIYAIGELLVATSPGSYDLWSYRKQ